MFFWCHSPVGVARSWAQPLRFPLHRPGLLTLFPGTGQDTHRRLGKKPLKRFGMEILLDFRGVGVVGCVFFCFVCLVLS